VLDLETERAHLAMADRHIAQTERQLAELEDAIRGIVTSGGDVVQAQRTRQAIEGVLGTFRAHRESIVQVISAIEAGKL
jgi:hypothetical protein